MRLRLLLRGARTRACRVATHGDDSCAPNRGREKSRPGTLRACATLFLLAAAPMLAQLTIVTDTVPDAALGQPYPAVNIATSGATGPVTWSFVNAPSPPPGFVI